jgi:hypothetical protein
MTEQKRETSLPPRDTQSRTMLSQTLDSDVLQIILDAICDVSDISDSYLKKPWTRLIPLSLVCKRLRSECLPHLFREYRYTITKSGRLIPKQLWCFIKYVVC